MSAVAVELCTVAAASVPTSAPLMRLLVQKAMAERSDAPKARIMPVRIMRAPQSSSATPPRMPIRISLPLKCRSGRCHDGGHPGQGIE